MARFESQEDKSLLYKILDVVELFIGAACLVLLAWEFGSTRWGVALPAEEKTVIGIFDYIVVIVFLVKYLINFLSIRNKIKFLKIFMPDTAAAVLLIIFCAGISGSAQNYIIVCVKIFLGIFYPFRVILHRIIRIHANTPLLIAFSFLTVIVCGTIVLSLPKSFVSGNLSILNSFFTATSATCVTGLVVVDTGTYFTPFGQAAILIMIQIGGLSLMTFVAFFIFAFKSKMAFKEELMIRDALALGQVSGLSYAVLFIIVGTIFVEAAGAALLYFCFSFPADMSVGSKIFFSVFHSISAFCNAGFGLLSDSFSAYRSSIPLNLVSCFLILTGGLGFAVNMNLIKFSKSLVWKKQKAKVHQFGLQTKIVILFSLILVATGALAIYLLESANSYKEFSTKDKILASVFQSVSARTAGFNTVDFSVLSDATKYVIIFLMFIGASPGSTGGGVKTSTVFVLILMILSRLRNRENVEIFKKTLPQSVISNCLSILAISVTVVFLSSLALTITEKGTEFIKLLFESVSAFATVGYSTGITPFLSAGGKIVLILTMFIGRIGPLTMVLAMSMQTIPKKYKYPEESVMMG
ncbi:MAG: potassium transporter TrkG [Planctomycetota bacterium]